MKMKILGVLVIGFLMFSLMGVSVLAENSGKAINAPETVGLNNAAFANEDLPSLVSEDDDVTNSSGIARDRVRSWFVFNKERKANIKMRIAKKKMFEVGEKVRKHPEKAKELAKEYQSEIDSSLNDFDKIAIGGDKDQIIKALKRTVVIKFKLENHKEKSSEIYEKILNNKTDQMTNEQLTHLEDVFSTIQQHIDDSIAHVDQTQENLKSRLVILGVKEDVLDSRMEKYESVLKDKETERQDHAKELKDRIKEHRAEIEQRIETENSSERGHYFEDSLDNESGNEQGNANSD